MSAVIFGTFFGGGSILRSSVQTDAAIVAHLRGWWYVNDAWHDLPIAFHGKYINQKLTPFAAETLAMRTAVNDIVALTQDGA